MKKETKRNTAEHRSLLDDKKTGYYELALYFAATKAQEEGFQWENFIDNLSYICDKYAYHIQVNKTSHLGS